MSAVSDTSRDTPASRPAAKPVAPAGVNRSVAGGLRRIVQRCGGWSGALGTLIILAITLAAICSGWITPYDPIEVNLDAQLASPSWAHWMGTDPAGRDILSRVILGARASLMVGVLAVVIGMLGGVSLGLTAGYFSGGVLEQAIMRIMDVIGSIPLLIWAIAVIGMLGVGPVHLGPITMPHETKLILLIGFLYIPNLARLTYSMARTEALADYVRARRAQGAGEFAIMFGDVLPNCLTPVIVQGTLLVAIGIIVEASISFIGLGVQPPTPSWGTMLAESRNSLFSGEWWLPLFPGLAISVTVVAFNLLGDALRDALDPRRRTTGLVA
jgi:peptide/nickel transport system permease protein